MFSFCSFSLPMNCPISVLFQKYQFLHHLVLGLLIKKRNRHSHSIYSSSYCSRSMNLSSSSQLFLVIYMIQFLCRLLTSSRYMFVACVCVCVYFWYILAFCEETHSLHSVFVMFLLLISFKLYLHIDSVVNYTFGSLIVHRIKIKA